MREKQAGLCEFEARLAYIDSEFQKPGQCTESLSQNKQRRNKNLGLLKRAW